MTYIRKDNFLAWLKIFVIARLQHKVDNYLAHTNEMNAKKNLELWNYLNRMGDMSGEFYYEHIHVRQASVV